MTKVVLLNKPYGVLSQFTAEPGQRTLAEFVDIPDVYAAGRLDKDSEGLMLLTDDGRLQHQLASPDQRCWKTYWVQVEGNIDDAAITQLQQGVTLKDGMTRPARARVMDEPESLWPRTPPVRFRQDIPTSWLEISLREGRNRQVRRMTAAVGFPTLRLIRVAIGEWRLNGMQPGDSCVIENA